MEDYKFISLIGDQSASFSVQTSKENLIAFADYLIDRSRERQQRRQEQEERQVQDSRTLLSRKETCEYLGVCEAMLWKWAKIKYLVSIKTGSKVRYRKSELDRIKFGSTSDPYPDKSDG